MPSILTQNATQSAANAWTMWYKGAYSMVGGQLGGYAGGWMLAAPQRRYCASRRVPPANLQVFSQGQCLWVSLQVKCRWSLYRLGQLTAKEQR